MHPRIGLQKLTEFWSEKNGGMNYGNRNECTDQDTLEKVRLVRNSLRSPKNADMITKDEVGASHL
jgi:hypothetical protein